MSEEFVSVHPTFANPPVPERVRADQDFEHPPNCKQSLGPKTCIGLYAGLVPQKDETFNTLLAYCMDGVGNEYWKGLSMTAPREPSGLR